MVSNSKPDTTYGYELLPHADLRFSYGYPGEQGKDGRQVWASNPFHLNILKMYSARMRLHVWPEGIGALLARYGALEYFQKKDRPALKYWAQIEKKRPA